jgi:tetratricopeptide (TPR) repeat protein
VIAPLLAVLLAAAAPAGAATSAAAPARTGSSPTAPAGAAPAATDANLVPEAPPRVPPPAGDARDVRRFTDRLLEDGDFYRAIGEYKRYLFLAPDAPDRTGARLAIGRAYLAGDRAADAAAWFDTLAAAESDPAIAAAWRYQAGLARLADEDFPAAADDLEAAAAGLPGYRGRALTLRGFALVASDRDEEAVATLRLAAREPDAGTLAPELADELARRDELVAHRSPALAGVLSAIVPGAGHAYVGDVGLGLTALAWNGLFAWGLYQTVDARLWGLTAVVGVFEALFYGGAITGSVAAAHKFNRDARLNQLDDLRRRYPALDVRRSTVGGGP